MAKADGGKREREQVRLQVVLCESVAKEVERHARELDHSQAWVVGWSIRNTLRHKDMLGNWVVNRIRRAQIYQRWATASESGSDVRLQLRIDRDVVDDLETIATALNQSPLKLAALMVEHALENFGPSLFAMKTGPGKFVRWLVQGDEDFKNYDVEEDAAKDANTSKNKE